ncbi:MAG TPA: A24 family peptidase [Telluria sp.]|nr:A24 family peptidase [Telluria sp.]
MNTPSTAQLLPALLLGLALTLAVWHDVKARRIPNFVVLAGTAGALLLHLFMPSGESLFAVPAGSPGIASGLGGFACGLFLLLPFYALQTLGAGDVKLMAMVGSFLGPAGVAGAVLLSMVAGGALALAVALWTGQLRPVLDNVAQMLRSALVRGIGGVNPAIDQPASATGKLPYAIAIATGTAVHLAMRDWPVWHLFS